MPDLHTPVYLLTNTWLYAATLHFLTTLYSNNVIQNLMVLQSQYLKYLQSLKKCWDYEYFFKDQLFSLIVFKTIIIEKKW